MIEGYFRLRAKVYYNSKRPDLDNSLKILLDCLQMTGTIKNDRQCVYIEIEKFVDRKEPRVEYEITPVVVRVKETPMARPNKMGLDYFPFDVDFFNDEKIVAISGEFGIKGEIVVIKLLCAIYRNGYFILWNDLLKFKLLRDLPGVSSELLDSIMNRLVLWGFFDKDLFDSMGVLTSAGIQKRYFKISKRRKSVDDFRYY